MSTTRLLHTDSRTSENFNESKLQTLTSQDLSEWGRYNTKELLDNSLDVLDESDTAPSIRVEIDEYENGVGRVLIRDNGPGISEAHINQIFGNIDHFVGSKSHYCLPTRGNQGNALMTILGIAHNCDRKLRVASSGKEYLIHVTENPMEDGYESHINKTGESEVEGTLIEVDFGEKARDYSKFSRVKNTVRKFVALNPHVDFTVVIDGDVQEHPANPDPTHSTLSLGKNATTGKVTWFSPNDFIENLKADVKVKPNRSVEDFARKFCKISSRNKWKSVKGNLDHLFDKIPSNIRGLFSENGEPNEAAIFTLQAAMQNETSDYSENSIGDRIGSVGNDLERGLLDYCSHKGKPSDILKAIQSETDTEEFTDLTDLSVYKSGGAVFNADKEDKKSQPFHFELAAVPTGVMEKGGNPNSRVIFGINQSIAYSTPSFGIGNRLKVKYRNNKKEKFYKIGGAFDELGHSFTIICNLTCPNIDFHDKGKQGFKESPFVDVIGDVVGQAVRKVINDKIRPRLNDLRAPEPQKPTLDKDKKAPNGFIKETVYELFDDAYNKTTEYGKYTPKMRQLFYDMRPMFIDKVEDTPYEYSSRASIDNKMPLKLRYGTFTSNVDDYEQEVLGERVIHRDARGFFVEPHSNKRVELGTTQVNNYTPDISEYGAILLVEKKGFFDMLHKQFEISKRYDIGLINAQGMSTNACRDLIESVQTKADDEEKEVTIYTLTDLDISGVGIAYDAGESDDLSTVDEFNTELLGLTLDAVKEWDLPAEPADYKDRQFAQLDTLHDEGKVDDDLYNFFSKGDGQRVEINALSPPDLKDYLESRLDELGVEKVEPEDAESVDTPDIDGPDEIREDSLSEAVGQWVLSEGESEVLDALSSDIDHDRVLEPCVRRIATDGTTLEPCTRTVVENGEHRSRSAAIASELGDDDLGQEVEELPRDEDEAGQEIYDETLDELEDNPSEHWEDIVESIVEDRESDYETTTDGYERSITGEAFSRLSENYEIKIVPSSD